jgi:hypothetical protein
MSVGVTKSTHFCMGRALPSSLFYMESQKCACGERSTPDGCCDDQLELVKLENDHSAGLVMHSPIPEFNLICEIFLNDTNDKEGEKAAFEVVDDHHLPPPKIPIYKRICSLVFYESLS